MWQENLASYVSVFLIKDLHFRFKEQGSANQEIDVVQNVCVTDFFCLFKQ